jgi:putative pyruvate formate lyase activating enzyme
MGPLPVVARRMRHHWEEPCISGRRGSGAVFFAGCGLGCVYCQNGAISAVGSRGGQTSDTGGATGCSAGGASEGSDAGDTTGDSASASAGLPGPVSPAALAQIFAELADARVHNINLVTPTHFARGVASALEFARRSGLLRGIPVIYNTSGYETVETLKRFEGLVDVYLPDMKYADAELAARYSNAPDYPGVSRLAVLEMLRQTGPAALGDDGLIRRGLMIRHLILPGHTQNSIAVLDWIADNLPHGVAVSLMSQFTPQISAKTAPASGPEAGLARGITKREAARVESHMLRRGLYTGYVQSLASADAAYIPDFHN